MAVELVKGVTDAYNGGIIIPTGALPLMPRKLQMLMPV